MSMQNPWGLGECYQRTDTGFFNLSVTNKAACCKKKSIMDGLRENSVMKNIDKVIISTHHLCFALME